LVAQLPRLQHSISDIPDDAEHPNRLSVLKLDFAGCPNPHRAIPGGHKRQLDVPGRAVFHTSVDSQNFCQSSIAATTSPSIL